MLVFAAGFAEGTEQCGMGSFKTDLKDTQCLGLVSFWPQGQGPRTPAACAQACCDRGVDQCTIWQFSPGGDVGKEHELGGCWVGKNDIPCVPYQGWVGGMANEPKASCPGGGGQNATVFKGRDIHNKHFWRGDATGPDDCCAKCRLARCKAWVYNPNDPDAHCYLKVMIPVSPSVSLFH